MRVNRVHLTFDTLYRTYREMPFNDPGLKAAEMCPRDYDIQVEEGDGWATVASETGNYRRFRVHEFPPVRTRRLRLVVKSTNGEGWQARVYEIRAYGP